MTTRDVLLWTLAYLVELVAVVWFTRPGLRRFLGVITGGVVVSVIGIRVITWCESLGWWRVPFGASPWFRPLFLAGLAASLAPVYLVTWRVARRFGRRGLAVFFAIVTVIGPPRDYFIAATFPLCMVFSPGLTPVLADAATYLGMMAVGHAVMRLVAGPAGADPLARRRARTPGP